MEEKSNLLYELKEMITKNKLDRSYLGEYAELKLNFIYKYGIDNIIRLDEETNGIFSHFLRNGDIYLSLFVIADAEASEIDDKGQLTYSEFKERIYEVILDAKQEDKLFSLASQISYRKSEENEKYYLNIDFIQGDFRREHRDLFIDGDFSEEIIDKFYMQHISFEDIRQNPELINALKWRNLKTVFLKKWSVSGKGGDKYGMANVAEFLSERIGKTEFFKLCVDYGKCLDKIYLSIGNENTSESIRKIIEDEIYRSIKQFGLKYFENLPLSFKEKYPELFLPTSISTDLRIKFYEGRLCFEDIRNHPEIKEILLKKDIEVGFFEIKQETSRRKNEKKFGLYQDELDFSIKSNTIWNILSKNEILDYAEKYGNFFQDVDPSIFKDGQSSEEREREIQKNIEENILSRISIYDETIPEFFKQKYPEMFLSDDAPKELKEAFYDKKLIKDKQQFNLKIINEHPEWRKFLIGKNLSRAFPNYYSKLFECMDSSALLKLTKKATDIEEMVDAEKEQVLANWYLATGKKFIPHYSVMLYIPENEIDNFIQNSGKWSQLMRNPEYNKSDEAKIAVLKIAYSMGVFHGNPKALEITNKLLSNQYGELTLEKAFYMFENFEMEYQPEFTKFLIKNISEILQNPEYAESIAEIQKKFKEIANNNASRKLTIELAMQALDKGTDDTIDIGNEQMAEILRKAGYSKDHILELQHTYNEQAMRKFSSIPRIVGENERYTYEILPLDHPLALAIGKMTDCCFQKGKEGESCMEHSALSEDGRIIVVKDKEGRIVAQSWIWRNQNVLCFDNIEVPNKIFELFDKRFNESGRKILTTELLDVYKKVASEIQRKDVKVYKRMLESGIITKKQYEALALAKITIGLGNNDIAEAIETDKELFLDENVVQVLKTDRWPVIYTDAIVQYVVIGDKNMPRSNQKIENLSIYSDEVPEYDSKNLPIHVLRMMKRIEAHTGKRKKLSHVAEVVATKNGTNTERIIEDIALEYGFNSYNTKVLATSRMALIVDEQQGLKIGDVLIAPTCSEVANHDKINTTRKHNKKNQKRENNEAYELIKHQIKVALRQMRAHERELDLSALDPEQQSMINSIVQELKQGSNRTVVEIEER